MGVRDLDEARQRIHDLAGEVDNIYTDVKYRAPMAELAWLSSQVVDELDAARGAVDALRTIVGDSRTYYAAMHHQQYAEQTLELYDKAVADGET
jgi:hypothetical protein